MKQLHTNNNEDIKKMLKDGYKYALRESYDYDLIVISRHKTYKTAEKKATFMQTIVDLKEIEIYERENKNENK